MDMDLAARTTLNLPSTCSRRDARAELDADVEEFLRRGGRVRRFAIRPALADGDPVELDGMHSSALGLQEPSEGERLLASVEAAFVRRGTTLRSWCRKNMVSVGMARDAVLFGRTFGLRNLRQRIVNASQGDVMVEASHPAKKAGSAGKAARAIAPRVAAVVAEPVDPSIVLIGIEAFLDACKKAFRAQYSHLATWCRSNGLNSGNVVQALRGDWNGPKARAIRLRVATAAGMDIRRFQA